MSVVLEPVVAETEEPVVATETVDDTPPPESVVEATAPEQEQTVVEPITPAPKKRGRPRKDPAAAPKPRAKAVPKRAATAPVPAPPPSSSDEEEPISQADLETEILHYLVQRKTHQQDRRRALWSQLAGLG